MVPGICSISELSEWAARDFTSETNEPINQRRTQ